MASESEVQRLSQRFETAVSAVHHVDTKRLNTEDKLHLYAFYKQATVGPCTLKKPPFYDMAGRAKWSAWKELGELSCEESRAAYVSFVDEFFPEWEEAAARGERGKSKAGTEDSTDDELGDDSDSGGGDSSEGADLGPTQSTLLGRMREDGELPSDDGEGSLHAIVQQDDPEVLDRALELATEAQISEGDDAGMTPLHWASDHGSVACAQVLLRAGAKVNVQDQDGQTPLHYASMCGHEALVRLLCQHGADASIADANGETPLQAAASDAIKAAMTA